MMTMVVGDLYYIKTHMGATYLVRIDVIQMSTVIGTHMVSTVNSLGRVDVGTVGHWDLDFFEREFKKATKLHYYLYGDLYE
jgi:hypothetical protein